MQDRTLFVTLPAARRVLRAGLALCAAALVAACGGDNECPASPPFEGSGNVGSCATDGGSAAPTASDLSLALSARTLPNDGTSTIKATVTAVDVNGTTLPEIPVTIRVDNGATSTPSGTATDDRGVVTSDIGAGADRANRTITVTAISGGLTRSATFQVTGASLGGTPLPAVIEPGAAGQVVFQLADISGSGAAMGGQPIVVNGVDGVEVSGTTDDSGKYTYSYTAPSATGSVSVKATAGGVSNTQTVLVQASGSGAIPPAAIAVQSASLAGSPSVVAANTESTSNQSELRALFLGAGNTPVKNVRVRFDLAGDLNNIGGTISSGSNLVYSDANGVATTSYVPGSRFSPTDGLTVRACWSATDFPLGTCPNATTTTLTVISQPLSVSIGTDALIEVVGQTYVKRYTVQVVDSSGLAKGGVLISPSIDLQQYFKGEWVVLGDKWAKITRASCDNEDLNRNGVLQVYSNGAVEDANATGFIEPRKADVAISFEGASTTDGNGQVELKITYPQNVGSWVRFNIQVAASGVAGTEGRTNFAGILPVLADAVSDPDREPPFVVSPYGTQTSPTVVTTTPTGETGVLCTNPN